MINTQIRFLAQFLRIIHCSLTSSSCSIVDFVLKVKKKLSKLKSFGVLALHLLSLGISHILTQC